MVKLVSIALLLIPCVLLMSLTLGTKKYVCPIDGTEFEALIAYSGTSYGAQLDFKRTGPIYSPWPIAQCPECGFVIYDDKAPAKEIDQLKPFILEGDFATEHKIWRICSRWVSMR